MSRSRNSKHNNFYTAVRIFLLGATVVVLSRRWIATDRERKATMIDKIAANRYTAYSIAETFPHARSSTTREATTRSTHRSPGFSDSKAARDIEKTRKYASSTDPTITTHDAIGSTTSNANVFRSKEDIGRPPQRILNVHIVPHTHDDVGWLKTLDQYYYGWNETIYEASVREILDSVIEALEENPSRTFVYVETKFFAMWWREQPETIRERVRRLVHETNQLTFANGGWCMHDEATTHFVGMIDQTTLGHAFLERELGVVPTVGWQLDPFGHSSAQASLMTYKMGFDALYFGRIDYQDLALRHATQACEGLWNANSSVGADGEDRSVFWGLTGSYRGQYGSPGGICLDPTEKDDYVPLIELNRTSLLSFTKDFLLALREQSDRTRGDHVMATLGEDFRYRRASVNFANIDLLLGTITRLQEDRPDIIASIFGPEYDAVNVFYSSPEYYTLCKHNETVKSRMIAATVAAYQSSKEESGRMAIVRNLSEEQDSRPQGSMMSSSLPQHPGIVEWPVKHDDFLPYSDCPHCFWTGFFTSRPSLKRFERVGSSFLLAVRQVESAPIPVDPKTGGETVNTTHVADDEFLCDPQRMHELEDAIGILQHHDGVAGTSKQHVAYDYAKSLQAGMDGIIPCTIGKLKRMLIGKDTINYNDKNQPYLEDLAYCQLLNETRCNVSVDATRRRVEANGSNTNDLIDLYVVIYNSLASERSAVIDLPVGSSGTYLVETLEENGTSESTRLQTQPTFFRSLNRDEKQDHKEVSVLSFLAPSLPAAGAKIFRIRKAEEDTDDVFETNKNNPRQISSNGEITEQPNEENSQIRRLQMLSNGHFSLLVDTRTGDIFRAGSKGIESLSSWGYYTSFDSERIEEDMIHNYKDISGDNGVNQNSGAYVFRPSHPTEGFQTVRTKNATIVHTSLGTEIRVEYEESWIQTVAKLRTGMPYLEIEYQVGPIPIDDGRGKEVVIRYNTMVENHGVFYTDSNGREFLRRQRNHRPTWNLTVYEPTAGNYYPINTAIYVDEVERATRDESNHTLGSRKTPAAFAVLTDRTQGGGSILDGTIELMVHRRTLADDRRGVEESINETMAGIDPCPPFGNSARHGSGLIIRGKHRVLVENNSVENQHKNGIHCTLNELTCGGMGGARLARSLMDETFLEPMVFVATAPASEAIPFRATRFSGLTESLPKNVMLITKKCLYDQTQEEKTYLVRLGHQYGSKEDPDLSRPVEVDLAILFPGNKIHAFHETTLSGNRAMEDWRKKRFDWTGSSSRGRVSGQEAGNNAWNRTTVVTLASIDIRTFIVTLEK